MKLDDAQIEALLANDGPKSYPIPEQFGPLRYHEPMVPCASRGCRAPTPWKLQGIPYCYIHCLRKMNEMLQEFGVEK